MGIPGEQIAKAAARARRIANLDGEVEMLHALWKRDARQFPKALCDAKRRMSEGDFTAIIIALSARGINIVTLKRFETIERLGEIWDTTRDARQLSKALSDVKRRMRRMPEEDFAAMLKALSARTGLDIGTLERYASDRLTVMERRLRTVWDRRNV